MTSWLRRHDAGARKQPDCRGRVSLGTSVDVDEGTLADVVFLREQEKMAHDVYVVLGQQWPLPIFANIQESEQRHMDTVLSLLQAAGVADLAASAAVATDPTVLAEYANLAKGSRNHLRSFVSQIGAAGGAYVPQLIDAATYQASVSSPIERGHQATDDRGTMPQAPGGTQRRAIPGVCSVWNVPVQTTGEPMNRAITTTALALLVATLGATASGSTPGATAAPDASGIGRSPSADLTYMREEEKLAHDVYVALGKRWDLPPFRNIPASEARHMEAMRTLLVRADLADPAAGRKAGEFSDPHLQALYSRLVEKGSASRVEALVVGATIEDLDLRDLEIASAATKDENARAVYANLARASRNHLRAFTSLLAAEGGTYAPQYIDAVTYASILASPMERGGRGGCGRGGGRGPGAGGSPGGGRGAGGGGGCVCALAAPVTR